MCKKQPIFILISLFFIMTAYGERVVSPSNINQLPSDGTLKKTSPKIIKKTPWLFENIHKKEQRLLLKLFKNKKYAKRFWKWLPPPLNVIFAPKRLKTDLMISTFYTVALFSILARNLALKPEYWFVAYLVCLLNNYQANDDAQSDSYFPEYIVDLGLSLENLSSSPLLYLRQEEVTGLAEAINKHLKVIIYGPQNSGKTSLIEQLIISSRLNLFDSPALSQLNKKIFFQLNIDKLFENGKYFGEIESRLEEVFSFLNQYSRNVVLVIDGLADLDRQTLSGLKLVELSKHYLSSASFPIIVTSKETSNPILESRFFSFPLVSMEIEVLVTFLSAYAEDIFSPLQIQAPNQMIERIISKVRAYMPDASIINVSQQVLNQIKLTMSGFLDKGNESLLIDQTLIDQSMQVLGFIPKRVNKEIINSLVPILKQRLIGQDEAIEDVTASLHRAAVGLNPIEKPIGSYLFVGPSGVGKTELAKQIAKVYFNDQKKLIRFDMSEFQLEHQVSRLIGAPPGYIGSDQKGQLTKAMEAELGSVILFDEVEKAHPRFFDLLLQILDEGILTDATGHKINFRNSIIIMTSNLGSEYLYEKSESMKDQLIKEKVMMKVKSFFRLEMLNRLDKIIHFNPLNEYAILKIAYLEVIALKKRLQERGYQIEITNQALEVIAKQGYHYQFGARELKRTIVRLVETPLAKKIIQGKIKFGQKIQVDVNNSNADINITDVDTFNTVQYTRKLR